MTKRILGGAVVVLIAGVLLIYGSTGAVRVWHMKLEIEALERDLTQLRAQTEKLTETVERLRNDPHAIETRMKIADCWTAQTRPRGSSRSKLANESVTPW